ncbi:MAG: P-type conjugative transfer protein TrbJ [Proteobacteria bacterium]|nr:P-type conjugative transfer protein TrbJ [Desulfobulbaceae bacterium]MBU4152964.1 P-type conjugative transfer protein TrbJ [Pseudomonadota bacterium]
MKITKKLSLEIALLGVLLLGHLGVKTQAIAGIPVFDAANLAKNMVSSVELVSQTLKQVQQYQTQLQQYENMLQNTQVPSMNTWDAASATMTQLRNNIDTLSVYKNRLGSTDAYLGTFHDTASYRNSPCYSPNGCTPAQWAELQNSADLGSESQKRANDALFRGLDQQQTLMVNDANTLETLQGSAQGATGQLQAIGYANQLASAQANQLLQIRGLLISQQNVIATRNQALADREAKEAAASVQARRGTFQPSSLTTY